ncbi:Diacylglycerol O-acyltransferase protein [Dioscorea alata]|uniref:Diacylglycerol O-acyltransferase protein n=1 Tax=Dioscorea alata TaxID=55571 RepID=A0ACB7UZP9_DIOAL|nr:Diacylglycerol O-acyltransferase protein [Dioscorea alata]
MEASSAVLRQSTVVTGEGWLSGRRGRVKKGVVSVPGGRFVDDGHLRYYVSCGGKKKEEKKKRAKLVKGLEKDLSALYSIGFGVEPEHGLTGEIQTKMFSEAAEVLLKQLKQLRVEEEEMKRKRKEEKAAKKAAKKMMMMKEKEDDDSESSCSSGSECCSATMELKSPETLIPRKEVACSIISNLVIEEKQTGPMNKIEVCMGGKCKRSGAMQLLEEIDKKVGVEGAVVGCKCMGKCRDAPNVRVLKKDGNEEETLKQGGILCILVLGWRMWVLLCPTFLWRRRIWLSHQLSF